MLCKIVLGKEVNLVEFYEGDFRQLLHVLNEGICYLNAQGEPLYYNQAILTHWSIDDPSQLQALALQEPVARALAGEQVIHELVQVNDQRTLLVNALPLLTETQSLNGAMIISQDVSEHALIEKQAQIALDILAEAIFDTQSLDDIDEMLRRMAALLAQMQSVDTSLAFRLDNTTGKIIPLAFYGLDEQSYAERHTELATIEHVTQDAIRQPSPAYIHAIRLGSTFKVNFAVSSEHSNPHNLLAAIYAPVQVNNRVVGLLGVERHRQLDDRSVSYFPQWSVALLTALARLASMSIEKAELLGVREDWQQEVERLRSQLQRQEDFLVRVAHDLKNPLTTILGQAQILHRRLTRILNIAVHDAQETHELLHGLRTIEQQTRKVEVLINSLVEVSRIDLNRLELYSQEVDLLRLVRRAIKEYTPLTVKHALRLFIDGEEISVNGDEAIDVSPVRVQGDERRLEQVVIHLLGNAVKYSPAGGQIMVSLWHRSEGVELTIEDQGIGIPKGEQAHITERFYRAENAVKAKIQGLGLGLYLVDMLVSKHGGSLSIESEGVPGKGSRVSITLPYRQT